MHQPTFITARALAEFADVDASAEGRITAIAKGTQSPVGTLLRALRAAIRDTDWHDMIDAMGELYRADNQGDADDCADMIAKAAWKATERDFDGRDADRE